MKAAGLKEETCNRKRPACWSQGYRPSQSALVSIALTRQPPFDLSSRPKLSSKLETIVKKPTLRYLSRVRIPSHEVFRIVPSGPSHKCMMKTLSIGDHPVRPGVTITSSIN